MPVNTSNNKNEDTVFSCSSMMKTIADYLDFVKHRMMNGECTDEELAHHLSIFSPTTNGYYNPDNYVTVDEGMKIMCMGKNRVGFIKLMRKNGINSEMFNNKNIGYPKDKVLIIRNKHLNEYKAKMVKQRNKTKLLNNIKE